MMYHVFKMLWHTLHSLSSCKISQPLLEYSEEIVNHFYKLMQTMSENNSEQKNVVHIIYGV
jgi:hypothetical protein